MWQIETTARVRLRINNDVCHCVFELFIDPVVGVPCSKEERGFGFGVFKNFEALSTVFEFYRIRRACVRRKSYIATALTRRASMTFDCLAWYRQS